MKKQTALSIILLLCILAGCTSTRVWTSVPSIRTTDNSNYEARIEPLKMGYNFYVMFRLSLTNKTATDLEIDWNKTKYLLNGRAHGGFVYEGIDTQNIKKQEIPPDTIQAGETFSKEIAPYRMLARAPLNVIERGENEEAIKAGPLPAGENGILLVVLKNGQELRKRIVIVIETTEEQDWF